MSNTLSIGRKVELDRLKALHKNKMPALCKKWIESGFLEIVDYSNKARKYKLAEPYDVIVKESL